MTKFTPDSLLENREIVKNGGVNQTVVPTAPTPRAPRAAPRGSLELANRGPVRAMLCPCVHNIHCLDLLLVVLCTTCGLGHGARGRLLSVAMPMSMYGGIRKCEGYIFFSLLQNVGLRKSQGKRWYLPIFAVYVHRYRGFMFRLVSKSVFVADSW